MEEQKAEERFEVAARYLCDRWGCFDFKQRNPGKYFFPQDEDLDGQVRLLKSDIDELGAVTAIKRRLRDQRKDAVSPELAAQNRLDLTVESLSLRPAWNILFDETERRTAAERLLWLISLASPSETSPPPVEDLNLAVDSLNHRIITWETDPQLPKSNVPYGSVWGGDRTAQTWCASVADSGRAFGEIGLIRSSLKQCDHYFSCAQCTQAWPGLHEPFRQFHQRTIDTCCEVLKVLRVCLNRARKERTVDTLRESRGDALAWRAIVCAAGAGYNDSIREVWGALTEIESGHVFGPVLHGALSGLDPQDIHALSLIEAASAPFIELQWFLYDDDDLIYLPSDGDLSEIPGVVTILNSTQVAEWKRLMTGSDLVFEQRDRDGGQGEYSLDADGLLWVLDQAAAFQTQKRSLALASTTDKIRQRAHELWEERTRSGAPSSEEQDWASAEREVLRGENRPTAEPERAGLSMPSSVSEAAIQSLSEGMTGLRDMIASNSAAQVPIIDTLQAIVNRIDGPSRYRAEQSIREALGGVVYNWLCPPARNAAVVAEYCWSDPNFPDPSKIVADLATAFERQLRTFIFEPFCKSLTAAGYRDYPLRPGVPRRSSLDSASASRPGPPVPLPDKSEAELSPLLKNGRPMTDRLTLGKMAAHLQRPPEKFNEFLEQQHIDMGHLRNVLPEITEKRNDAVHKGSPSQREEVEDIRRRWPGQTDGSPNIFLAIMPESLA